MSTATVNKFNLFDIKTRVYIARTLDEILGDPDNGLELSDRTKKILNTRLKSKSKLVSLAKVKKLLAIR